MKYIKNSIDGGWDLSKYFEYLEGVRADLPEGVYEFAANFDYYSIDSHRSLHDAWLDYFYVSEVAEGARSEIREIKIDCKFLGPFHDCYIIMAYQGVFGYRVSSPPNPHEESIGCVGHGDLLMHEVRLNELGHLIHEMHFSRGGVIEIACQRFCVDVQERH